MSAEQPYILQVTSEHVFTSAETLSELAEIASGSGVTSASAKPITVRIGHVDHGGFLSHLLYGFSVQPLTSDGLLADVGASHGQVAWAVVVNHPLETQLLNTLKFLASLIARQELMVQMRATNRPVDTVDLEVAAADQQAGKGVEDDLRVGDWRNAARQVRERATAAGFDLRVQFGSPLLSAAEIRQRAPMHRHVYNRVPVARAAIDRTATALSRGLRIGGPGIPEAVLAMGRDLLDVGQVRRFLAHLARDAFVCGNGYLEMRPLTGGQRVLQPENVEILDDGSFALAESDSGERVLLERQSVLHVPGMRQPGSEYGVSVLEPLVIYAAQLEIRHNALEDLAEMRSNVGELPEPAAAHAKALELLAQRTIADGERKVAELLGGATNRLREPPADLYFPNLKEMLPAMAQLRFVDPTLE